MPRCHTCQVILSTGLLGLLWGACSQSPPPVLEQMQQARDRVPVVFVPGVTGVELRDQATGKHVWGKGYNLIRPHDRGHGTARPPFPGRGGPSLLPDKVILDLRLFGLVRLPVYQPLVDLFVANGYSFGDLDDPRPADDFFLFAYDWRQDNVASAARLADKLQRLRRVRGDPSLRVSLVCQSNGAHICRYFAKYGALDLEAAETGRREKERSVTVDRLILVGTSNGGSLRILYEMNRGRKYVRGVGRYWSPETVFTYLSLFQDLPIYTSDLFVDAAGEVVEVDLFAAENWRRFGWSVFQNEVRQRLQEPDSPSWFGSEEERFGFLEVQLDRARRFHRALSRDVPEFGPVRYYLIMNRHHETSARAVLRPVAGGWETAFDEDRWVQRNPPLRSSIVVSGDGHATVDSQRALSPQEHARLAVEPIEVDGTHRRIILRPATHRSLLQILSGELDRRP